MIPRADRPRRRLASERAAAALVALAAGALVFVVAAEVFPYHSSNHDEAVYLQQAAMLLEGQLRLRPGALAGAFRPWFFVRDGGTLYPKYAPVPAAVFALGKLAIGEYRAALAAVAAANAALVYAVSAAAFDRRTGVVAAAALVGAPLFLVVSSLFLPYAPTFALELMFALAYVRAARLESARYAALAGVAIGTAFFARPYTAVLFAAPFVAHAGWALAARRHDRRSLVPLLRRYGAMTVGGVAMVAVALAYNAVLTGSPLVFPYEAFAPRDGLGFGRRRILGHAVEYTPSLALRTTGRVVQELLTRWTVAGPIGSAFAGVGLASVLIRARRGADTVEPTAHGTMPPAELRAVLVGLAVSVIVGNTYFWGNYNILADFADPNDGLIALFGPFYHFDLLLPLSAFGAAGAVAAARRFRTAARRRLPDRTARVVLALTLVVGLPAATVAAAAVVDRPVSTHLAYTEKYERAYAPFELTTFDDALVFLPTPYGRWTNHPFQHLRNDPGFDGAVVYALDRDPRGNFAVLDAYPNRTYYRYRYRGTWTPDPAAQVVPKLERLRVETGPRLRAETTVGVPAAARSASVRLSNGDRAVTYDASDGELGDRIAVRWTVAPDGASVTAIGGNRSGSTDRAALPIRRVDEVVLTVTLVDREGGTLTYRQAVTVRDEGDRVTAVWPPETSVCRLVTDCGDEGTYLPNHPASHRDGVWVNASAVTEPVG